MVVTRLEMARKKAEEHPVLGEFYAHLASKGVSGHHAYTCIVQAAKLLRFLRERGKSIADMEQRDVEEFLAGKARTVHAVIRIFIGFLKERGYVSRSISVKVPKRRIVLPEVLSREEVSRLIDAIDDLFYKSLVAVMYETGARISEVLGVRYGDVEAFEYGFKVRIKRSKSEARTVLVVEYAPVLAAYLNTKSWRRGEPLWPVHPDTVRKVLRKAGERIGIKAHPHMLRHSRATHLYLTHKFTEKELMLLFGWKTRDMIDVYARLVESDAHRAYLSLFGYKAREEREEELVQCPRCGQRNSPKARFCVRCGYPLGKEEREEVMKREVEIEEIKRELDELKRMFGEFVEALRRA